MRLFIAIDVLDKRISYVVSQIQQLLERNEVKGTYPSVDQLHITLKFLGETPESKIELINHKLKSINLSESVVITVDGVGAFPSLVKPRIIFLHVNANEALYNLQKQIEETMVSIGFKRESRVFKPHITIYRIKKPWTWKTYLEKNLRNINLEVSLKINNFKLKESILTPKGPIYKDIFRYEFGD